MFSPLKQSSKKKRHASVCLICKVDSFTIFEITWGCTSCSMNTYHNKTSSSCYADARFRSFSDQLKKDSVYARVPFGAGRIFGSWRFLAARIITEKD